MATKTKRLRLLAEAYAEIPDVACKGLCWRSCSFINVEPVEVLAIAQATGKPVELVDGPGDRPLLAPACADGTCPHLNMKTNRCSIYAARPAICRAFGVAQGLRCRFGCTPTRTISDAAMGAIFRRIAKL